MEISQSSQQKEQSHDSMPEQRLPKLKKKQQVTFLNKIIHKNPLNHFMLYSAIQYTVFFEQRKFINDIIPIYIAGNTNDSLNKLQNNKPIILCFHGAGQSAMSFCQISKYLKTDFILLAYDMSLHGQSRVQNKFQSDLSELRLSNLVKQGIQVFKWVLQSLPSKSKIYLIGHSLGGSICVRVADYYLNKFQNEGTSSLVKDRIAGVLMIDAIEGVVKNTKQNMKRILNYQPKQFKSIQAAVWWTVSSQNIKNLSSARGSVPPKLHQVVSRNEKQQVIGKHYEMKVKLLETSSFWEEWFDGLSKIFINLPTKKLLFTSSLNRLDAQLLKAHEQKQFVLQLFCFSGHFIHQDQYEKVSNIILQQFKDFERQNQKQEIKNTLQQ